MSVERIVREATGFVSYRLTADAWGISVEYYCGRNQETNVPYVERLIHTPDATYSCGIWTKGSDEEADREAARMAHEEDEEEVARMPKTTVVDNRNVYSDVDEFDNPAHDLGLYGPLSFSEANGYRILRECIDKHLVCFEDDVAEVAIWCEAVERTARERSAAYEVIFRSLTKGALSGIGTCDHCGEEERHVYVGETAGPDALPICRECLIEIALEGVS